MPRKPVRGRYQVVVPLEGGGSFKVESLPTKFLTAAELVDALREQATFIETHFVNAPKDTCSSSPTT